MLCASASVAGLAGELAERSAAVLALGDPSGPGAAALARADVVLESTSTPRLAGWLSPLTTVLPRSRSPPPSPGPAASTSTGRAG